MAWSHGERHRVTTCASTPLDVAEIQQQVWVGGKEKMINEAEKLLAGFRESDAPGTYDMMV